MVHIDIFVLVRKYLHGYHFVTVLALFSLVHNLHTFVTVCFRDSCRIR